MKLTSFFLLLYCILYSPQFFSQQENNSNLKTDTNITLNIDKTTFSRKGKMYFYWGYNRSAYTNSDIRLKGKDYDFTIKNVKGSDDPTTTFNTYIDPSKFSIPQYDWRIGYYITDKYSISLGHSHMKYKMEDQIVKMTGKISTGEFAGEYNDTPIRVGEDDDVSENTKNEYPTGIVSKLEHCDGLNNFTIELGRTENLWISRNGKHSLSLKFSFGAGATVTDTEAEVLGVPDPNHGDQSKVEKHSDANNEHGSNINGFHLSGYTTSLGSSLQFDFFKHFFIQAQFKGGYVNLVHFVATHEGGRGSQKLGYIEGFVGLGYNFQLFK